MKMSRIIIYSFFKYLKIKMSLLASASPWTNGNNTENKKRPSTMRKSLKNLNIGGGPDDYNNEETVDQTPPTIQDVQTAHENRSNQVNNLIQKITTEDDGQHLANFNPMPNPIINHRKPPLESRDTSGEIVQSNPFVPPRTGNNYGANDSNLGKLSNYNTSYQPANIPYYSKMGIGAGAGAGAGGSSDKLMEKINYMIHLLEEQQNEKTNNITEEFILYTFLGVFMIYIADSFVRAGRYVR
jgi:hypothetical protein